MWPPPNILSLPSKEEIQNVKDGISIIELEIIETELRLDALRKSLSERKAWISPIQTIPQEILSLIFILEIIETELMRDALRKSLSQRKAWIAPIRTIPPEIISLIFIEASRTDWKTPLILQSVSRRWRDVVLDSPEAWTLIPLSKPSSERRTELISLFFERSHNQPLHISVGDDTLLGNMESLARRLKCFYLPIRTVFINRYLQSGYTFHRLERLKISRRFGPAGNTLPIDDLAAWDMLLFPNLKVLVITALPFSLMKAISAAPEFPAIQHLTLHCEDNRWLPEILTKCATSLESAELVYSTRSSGGSNREYNGHFPRLRYLRLLDYYPQAGPSLCLNATTPNLQAYLVYGDISTLNNVKVDTDSVTFLQVSSTLGLSRYPRLVTLRFSKQRREQREVVKAIGYLRDNPALCPGLTLIEYTKNLSPDQQVKAKNALMALEEVTGHTIQLKRGTPNVREQMEALRGMEICGDHMPCKFCD